MYFSFLPCPVHLNLLDLITLLIFCEEYTLWNCSSGSSSFLHEVWKVTTNTYGKCISTLLLFKCNFLFRQLTVAYIHCIWVDCKPNIQSLHV
jgi:hypothetical protein